MVCVPVSSLISSLRELTIFTKLDRLQPKLLSKLLRPGNSAPTPPPLPPFVPIEPAALLQSAATSASASVPATVSSSKHEMIDTAKTEESATHSTSGTSSASDQVGVRKKACFDAQPSGHRRARSPVNLTLPMQPPTPEVVRRALAKMKIGNGFADFVTGSFNGSQQGAMLAAAERDVGFTLVKGPPGTGKTTTLKGLLNLIHIREFSRYYDDIASEEYKLAKEAGKPRSQLVHQNTPGLTHFAVSR